jgi:hypothetical protein
MDKALNLINKFYADLYSGRKKNDFIYFNPPKNWEGTLYYFAYTPWKTKDPETGKEGFFTLKYRVLKSGTLKLVKKVRFGRRKIASKRAWKWHEKYYGKEDEK